MKTIARLCFLLWPGFLFAQTGNPVVLSIEDRWNADAASWEKSLKQAYEYDEFGREIYYGIFRWNQEESNWELNQEKRQNYTASYNETIEISYGKKKSYQKTVSRVDKQSDRVIYSENLHSDSLGNKEGGRYSISYLANGGWDGVQETFNNNNGSWQISSTDYSRPIFDANGCKIGTNAGNGNRPTTLETIQNDDQCRPLVILTQIWEYQGNLRNYSVDSIFYAEQVKIRKQYKWDQEDDAWLLSMISRESMDVVNWIEYFDYHERVNFHSRHEFDEKGNQTYNLLEYQLLPDTNWITERLSAFEYNDEGDITQFIIGVNYIDSLREWRAYYEYVYTYNEFNAWSRVDAIVRNLDDTGQVIEEIYSTNYEYDYFCRDLARLRTGFTNGVPSTRTFYNYLHPENCASSPLEELTVYPNPSRGLVFLEYDELTDGNLDVSITNTAGQVLRNIEVRQLTGLLEIDLSNQLNGLYFIWVKNRDGDATEFVKVLKHQR